VETPGIGPTAITVGNADGRGTVEPEDDRVYRTSGRGPTPLDGLPKPDVCAPGTSIRSCDTQAGYVEMTGTSMAAPMVAGAAVLLLSARPYASPDALKEALVASARPLRGIDPSAQGKGMIDIPAALGALPPRPAR
jgi:serine protease AprX